MICSSAHMSVSTLRLCAPQDQRLLFIICAQLYVLSAIGDNVGMLV